MLQLVVAVISIALVAALAIATLTMAGSAYQKVEARSAPSGTRRPRAVIPRQPERKGPFPWLAVVVPALIVLAILMLKGA